jgi:membrane-bound lytic murein transglycosylase D
MNSTRGMSAAVLGWIGALCVAVLMASLPAHAQAAETVMPRPPELERDVQFWIRVYTQVDTNGGFIHDEHNLAAVYDTLHFDAGASSRERQKIVERDEDRISAALRRIAAANGGPLSDEDQKIRELWGNEATPARLRDAADEVRFQLGQADRFREGLIRSGAWETHIAEALANLGLPPELAVLPHVESSFNPAAYSKVGAAGLWQFMRSTGRRYMRIDNAVDDRLDPFRSTEAAAQLLAYNYRLLGTWPLALTAYNHGAEGMRRAKEALGTDDIVRIVRNYKSRTFGFASRNFYVSFLAALEVDRNPEKYFGPIERSNEARFQEIIVPAFVNIGPLARALKIDTQKLRALNPALLRAVWDGQRHVPKSYRLRLPMDGEKWTSGMLAARLSPNEIFAGQPEPRRYRVRRGDTLVSVAEEYGLTPASLALANRVRTSAKLRPGRTLILPEARPAAVVAAVTPAPPQTPSSIAVVGPQSAPLTAQQTPPPPQLAQPEPVELVTNGIYVVQNGDSLSEIAKKVGLSEDELLKMNDLRNREFIFEGQQLTVLAEQPPPVASTGAPASTGGKPVETTVPPAQVASATGGPVGAGAVPAAEAERESAEDAAAVAGQHAPEENAQPVSAAQAEAISPALGPAAESQQSADPIDYSVGKDDTIEVAAAETLGHYADWLSVSAQRLRQINRMSHGRPVVIGHRLRLDFARVSREDFEKKRRDYHQTLQAAYFAAHRIVGSEVYIVRRGDSLWTVTKRFSQLPIWLLRQYNPDVDFTELRPGTQVVMPRVEDVVANGT